MAVAANAEGVRPRLTPGRNRVGGTLCPPGSGYGQPNIHTRLAEEDEVTICDIPPNCACGPSITAQA
eukprot:351335-Chlamydomonas_euryale.AAC.17